MALARQEIEALSEMVVAGGKSSATGGQGLMQAAGLIQVLQREMQALEAADKAGKALPLQHSAEGYEAASE
jgi:hypothetical protein